MAVCLDMNNKILSLVLEPFTTNINSMIYDSVSNAWRDSWFDNSKDLFLFFKDCKISMEDCVEYILQVIKAVIYLHENAIIHSNICSHNILVCENKKVIKLSSFELATEVDVTRIQNEIIYAFYGNLENFQVSELNYSLHLFEVELLIRLRWWVSNFVKIMCILFISCFFVRWSLISDHTLVWA